MVAARPRSLKETLVRFYRLAHERLLKAAEELSPEQFAWSAGPSLHSVAWQLWHAARWDDVLGSYLHRALAQDPRTQVWERESLAQKWSLAAGSMGRRDTGTEMSNDPDADTQLDNALIYLEHLSRHLGMIEAIRGLADSRITT
jgi:uncharacterized damage-inducible protein DinB